MKTKRTKIVLVGFFLLFGLCLSAQTKEITGKVTDSPGGPGLPGVTVMVKGTSTGVSTDVNGMFRLSVTPGSVLTFSFVGYLSQEVKVGKTDRIEVVLKEDVKQLDEVIVVGYATQRKVTTTGAITSVSNEELVKAPVAGVSNALVGLTSGIQALQNSGEFGNDQTSIRIRGIATLNAQGAEPLILVDGVERSTYNDIDPNEIETLNILKDASATAVFGVRGANGVILITTRQGQMGKPRVSISANVAGLQPSVLPRILNAYDYAELRNEAERNMGKPEVTFSDADLRLYRSHEDPIFHPDVDWMKELIRPLSFQQSYNANVSGGIEKMRYFISLGYFNQSGGYHSPQQNLGFPYKHSFDRYNVRMNFDFDLSKDFTVSVKLGNQLSDNLYPNGGAWAVFDKVTTTSPMASPGFVDGKLITEVIGFPAGVPQFNPWAQAGPTSGGSAGSQEKNFSNTLNTNVGVRYKLDKLTEGLAIRAMAAYDSYYRKYSKRMKYFPTYTVMQTDDERGYKVYQNNEEGPFYNMSESISDANKWRKMYAEAAIEYARTFDSKHRVSALFLANLQKAYYPSWQYKLPTAYLGFVGRLTYDYVGKYLAEVNVGYNGSENFPEGKRYGLFPSFSLGWVITEEGFLKDHPVLTFMKIRGSYGEVGNDKILGDRYMYLNGPYSLTDGGWIKTSFGTPGVDQAVYKMYKEGKLGNSDVTWERARKWNVGTDIQLWESRIHVTFDYFKEKRDNILWALSTVPELVAAQLPKSNIGKVENHGYEVEAEYKDRRGEVEYWVKGNYSFARSKILFQDEPIRAYEWLQRTGRPVGQYYGLTFEGFYNTLEEINDPDRPVSAWEGAGLQPGDMKYKDLNGDRMIDEKDMGPIGHANWPEVTYSFSFGGRWKGFDLSVLFQGTARVSTYFSAMAGAYPFSSDWGPAYTWNQQRWSQERYDRGEKINFPRVELSPTGHNYQVSSFWVQDGSYLRLKNVELGYTFSPAFLSRIGIRKMRVYTSGNNLYTWTKMDYPMDPDAREAWGRVYPPMRVYNLGVNFQF